MRFSFNDTYKWPYRRQRQPIIWHQSNRSALICQTWERGRGRRIASSVNIVRAAWRRRCGRIGRLRRTGMLSPLGLPASAGDRPNRPPARFTKPVLAPDQSAALRDRLVAELEALQYEATS